MQFIVNLGIISSIATILTLGIRKIYHTKVSVRGLYILWGILFIRLIVPVFPTSSISIFNNIPLLSGEAEKVHSLEVLDSDDQREATPRFIKQEYSVIYKNQEIASFYEFKKVVSKYQMIWLVGALGIFIYFNVAYLMFEAKISKYPTCTDKSIIQLLEKYKHKIKLHKNVEIIEYPFCPMVKGIFKPQILIPKGYSEEEIEYVLLHELNHIKGHDPLIHCIALIVLCINWFNPMLSYIAQKESDIKSRICKIGMKHKRRNRDYLSYILVIILSACVLLTAPMPVQAESNNTLEIPKDLLQAFETTIKEQAPECIDYEIDYICEEEAFIYLLLNYKKEGKTYVRFMVLNSTFMEGKEAFEVVAQEESVDKGQPSIYKWQEHYLIYGTSIKNEAYTVEVIDDVGNRKLHKVLEKEKGYIVAVKKEPSQIIGLYSE